jgi:predicted metal-dependent peptidase
MSQHSLKWQQAVTKLILEHPFFASLYLRLHVRPSQAIRTAGINNRELIYNPDFVESLSREEVVGLLAHEVMHNAMGHSLRLGARNPKRANIAGDYAINGILKDAGFSLPSGGLYDKKYKTDDDQWMALEQIYGMLPDEEEGKGPGGEGEGGEGEGGEGQGGDGMGGDGMGGDPGNCGGFFAPANEDGSGMNPQEIAAADAERVIDVKQAAQAAKMCGKLPAAIKKLVEEMGNPILDWREVLRDFITKTARTNYDWNRPNRRHIANGLYLPSIKGEELRPLGCYFDQSGSVGNDEQAQFAAELNAILSTDLPATVIMSNFDDGVDEDSTTRYTEDDYPVQITRTRCGGTSFAPVFDHAVKWMADSGEELACVIVLTDMIAGMPDNDPGVPVLWVSTSKPGNFEAPKFGEIAYLL